MAHPLYIVDAFTTTPLSGNPAAVCLPQTPVEADWMQRVAAEMNLSETAFLVPEGPGTWGIRWFTPRVEVDLCGHATLAAAHVLWSRGGNEPVLHFSSRGGLLTARRETGGRIRLDFPADPPAPADPARTDALAAALGDRPRWTGQGRYDLLAELGDAQAVRDLTPDMAALAALDTRGVMVTAAGDPHGADFVSRFFAPGIGIPEDPVTGSAHCCLAPYWADRLRRARLWARQLSPRGGELEVEVMEGDRVGLIGNAVTTMVGELRA